MPFICRDCQWWGADSFHLEPRSDGRRECAKVTDDGSLADIQWETEWVESPIYVFLFTAPDFGCVQFQAKESTDG